jgi:hypothetical protein
VNAFSQENFGISPQDLMHNDCRSDAYIDQLPHSIEINALTLGNTSSSKSSQYEDRDSNTPPPRDQNESFTFTQDTAKLAPQLFYGNERTSYQALNQHNDSLYHIQAQLRRKREELAAAEVTVSNLRNEIKLLEASVKRQSPHFEDTIKQKIKHKRTNDGILHGAKRLKGKATRLSLASETSEGLNVNGEESFNLTDLHFSTVKGPPSIITTAEERAPLSFYQNNLSTPKAPETPLAGVIQKPDQSLPLISQDTFPLRVERSSPVQPLSKQTPCSALLDESRERLLYPGRDFLERGLVNCRACSIEGLEQGIAWVA